MVFDKRNILVINPFTQTDLSGLSLLSAKLIGNFLKYKLNITTLCSKTSNNMGLHKIATEKYETPNGIMHVNWLPSEYFSKSNRYLLVYKLQELIREKAIDYIIAFDGNRSGFCSAVASHLENVTLTTSLTYRDIYELHLNSTNDIDIIMEKSDYVLLCNPHSYQHLNSFYDMKSKGFCLDLKDIYEAETFDLLYQEGELKFLENITENKTYIITSGHLSHLVNYHDLLDRICESVKIIKASLWIHAGSIDANCLIKLSRRLSLLGMEEYLKVTGIISNVRYKLLMSKASLYVEASGDNNTGIATLQANLLNIPVNPFKYNIIKPKKLFKDNNFFTEDSTKKIPFNTLIDKIMI